MLTEKVKESLKKNWGDKAEALECFVEVKFIRDFPKIEWYIFAMNSDDEPLVNCIIHKKNDVEIFTYGFDNILHAFNEHGEYPVIDEEFRPVKAIDLYRKLTFHG